MAPVIFTEDQLRRMRSIPPFNYTIMAAQAASNNATATAPATASTDALSPVDDFGSSSQSSDSNSTRTSVEITDRANLDVLPTKIKSKNPLPPLSREFPKPAEEIDVAEALSRKPGRWTLQGTLAVSRPAPVVDEEKVKAQRRQNLENAKKELFAASQSLNSAMPPPRKTAP
ncbi:hypothetical protein CSOJ01_00706 [Colletotrichum sojae]|uniref:Uncharacterized protein n=1 Tax=Colletotrichum sojae TaxID=2175907 RepID=A0A8H6JWH7_9PEZI|nr:hypothetical protein CSOJ01_00706 [Colletotrichum sojae]